MIFKDTRNIFKNQFRHIIYYSMPDSILFVLRKRLNFITLMVIAILFLLFTLL